MKKSLSFVLILLASISQAWAALDINRATPSQLEVIKGIGPAKARAIVEYRNRHGSFQSLDELSNVKGITKPFIAQLKAKGVLSVDGRAEPVKPKQLKVKRAWD